MGGWLTSDAASIVVAGFVVGIVVGLTGMGGGALMTPALIFLGVGGASAVVTADLTAAAISRSAGARDPCPSGLAEPVGWPCGSIIGSVPAALAGPWIIHGLVKGDRDAVDRAAHGVHRLRAAAGGHDVRAADLPQPAPQAQRTTLPPIPTRRSGRWSRSRSARSVVSSSASPAWAPGR